MSQLHLATLRCKKTGEVYITRINKKRRQSYADKSHKLKLNKYSKVTNKVEEFVETKKMHAKK